MQNRKRKFRLIILLFIILLVVLITLCVILRNLSNRKSSTHDNETPVVGSKNLVQDAYEGDINTLDISNRVTILFEGYLPLVVADALNYDDTELYNFYQAETKEGLIYKNLGIDNYEDFEEFILQLKKLDCDLSQVETVEYKKDSYEKGEKEDSMITEVSYNNGRNMIECKVYIPKKYNSNNNLVLRFEIVNVKNS